MKQQGQINREDMLELTRRMTLSRCCFSRIAGAWFDAEGFVDGTFNRHFLRLTPAERSVNLAIAKAVPFSKTNEELRRYVFERADETPDSIRQLLLGLKDCELKNDALLDVYYEWIGEHYRAEGDFAFFLFYGSYDVPLKGKDKTFQKESEEVYTFLIGAICPVEGDYEPGKPVSGFLFPAFTDRSSDEDAIEIYQSSGDDILHILQK